VSAGLHPYQACQLPGSSVWHFHENWNGREMTLCGRDADGWTMGRGDGRLCRVCHRIAVARLHPAMPSDRVAEAGSRLVTALHERDDARVWEIAGDTGIYHVTILPGVSLCTCMAGKTNPLVLCKHQAAAFLAMAAEKVDDTIVREAVGGAG
jgi:hypothetical protein